MLNLIMLVTCCSSKNLKLELFEKVAKNPELQLFMLTENKEDIDTFINNFINQRLNKKNNN